MALNVAEGSGKPDACSVYGFNSGFKGHEVYAKTALVDCKTMFCFLKH